MEGPGMSLFQGAASIHINNSVQDRLEEEEEIEDEKRRREELNNQLKNAFDDFDDDGSSVNSSANFTSMNLTRGQPAPGPDLHNNRIVLLDTAGDRVYQHHHHHLQYQCGDGESKHNTNRQESVPLQENDYNFNMQMVGTSSEYQQLKVMYEMRVKECEKLAARVRDCEASSESEIKSLRSLVTTAQADREKYELNMQQAQHLLESSKHTIYELEQRVVELTSQLKCSDESRQQMRLELETLSDCKLELERRLQTVKTHHYDTDTLFREQQDRHREEVERLLLDLEKTRNRLSDKESELKVWEKRCTEVERDKETVLIEKGEIVNKLSDQLRETQGKLVQAANERKSITNLKEQMKEMASKLERTAREFAVCRDELKEWQTLVQQLDTTDNLSTSPSGCRIAAVRKQLHQSQQLKKQLNTLTTELHKREESLESHKKSEQSLKSTVEDMKANEMILVSKLAILENKMQLRSGGAGGDDEASVGECGRLAEQLKSIELRLAETEMERDKLKEECGRFKCSELVVNQELRCELDSLTAKHREVLDDNTKLKTLYLQACKSKDQLGQQLSEQSIKLMETHEQLNTERQTVQQLRLTLQEKEQHIANIIAQSHAEQVSNADVIENNKQCDQYKETIDTLNQQVTQLKRQLENQSENDKLMRELRDKAESFERYICERYENIRNKQSVAVDTADLVQCKRRDVNQQPETTVDDVGSIMEKEKQIRHEIASQFAVQLKQIECKYNDRMKALESEGCAKMEQLVSLLENKEKEVETLKALVVSERERLMSLVKQRCAQLEELLETNRMSRDECTQLKEKLILYSELKGQNAEYNNTLNIMKKELELQLESQRKERDQTKQTIRQLHEQIAALQHKTTSLDGQIKHYRDKYKGAKKLAHTYKEYACDKDKHIGDEVKRIECQYEAAIVKLQKRLDEAIACRERQANLKITKVESDFETKLSKLNDVR